MKSINIITPDNGVGLSQDRSIVRELLERNGFECFYSTTDSPTGQEQYDLNIFLEVVYPAYFHRAKKNIIIPNPEWFFQEWKKHLPKFDAVFAKTIHTFEIFSTLQSKSTCYTGFTSLDRMDNSVKRSNSFAQFAGKSSHKGTNELIQATNLAELPHVTIFSHNDKQRFIDYNKVDRNKVTIYSQRLNNEAMNHAFNTHQFHICTSNYEGFGHYINEARSVGAIIITTNAKPMNELVTSNFGFGVASKQQMKKHGLIYLNTPEPAHIAKAILSASWMEQEQIDECSVAARAAYEIGKKQFEELFMNSIDRVL